ncbi:type II toxin-antitoxin system Phd/YefM family antitoxin [Streptomyces spinosisporus]|uniref:Antitoxin n=1 Tax=Streptomyces spinosisporus TaxID=2927582 RepID=A0ABS9XWN2_9ACTN|nr:type II toxin-antitoxin system Phd/YefM family antitoxin [Streptomyces spinosisporus]MCI3246489.1 type II toxin-antitoxin system Phd/YefM family antitoxin [Streptomyces spinosisporus]
MAISSYAVPMSERPTVHRNQIAEARNVLGQVIARARFAGEPTVLINRGKEAAVVVSYEAYEDADLLRELRAYLGELEAGTDPDVVHKARVIREALDTAKRRVLDST